LFLFKIIEYVVSLSDEGFHLVLIWSWRVKGNPSRPSSHRGVRNL